MMYDNFLNNELVNKLYYMHQALDVAQKNIDLLRQENICLKDVLSNLTSLNKEDYDKCFEGNSDKIISV